MSSCPICKSDVIKTDFKVKDWLQINLDQESPLFKFTKTMADNDGYGIEDICKCQACGFRFASPYPTNEALTKYYQEYYANRDYSAKLDKKVKRVKRRLKRLNKRKQYKSFLDVGCNVGTAVEAAKQQGLEANGIDIDADSIKMAQEFYPNNDYQVAAVQDFAKQGHKFDIVYSTEVLEHLIDPHSFVDAIHELLSDDGVLYLTTPDGGHWRTPKQIMRWHEMKLPEHISLFTKESLKKLMIDHNFEVPHFNLNIKPGIRMIARRRA